MTFVIPQNYVGLVLGLGHVDIKSRSALSLIHRLYTDIFTKVYPEYIYAVFTLSPSSLEPFFQTHFPNGVFATPSGLSIPKVIQR